jgi:ring-1,2-phenylacetyl-CoA epoxidase subunit PaaD
MVSPAGVAPIGEATIRAALADVTDPEIPTVSIVDLGIVECVDVQEDQIRIDLLPTFVGCPALEVIREAVVERLAEFDRPTRVEFTFGTPWTTDRLTAAGRDGLRRAGISPPMDGAMTCAFCGSKRVAMENLFGPTLCRSLFYCRDCRQPFEAFKPI